MKMIVVVPPRTHLSKPAPVLPGLLAKYLLDRGMHEDAIDLGIGCGALYKLRML
jgi:hypothetical protein